MSMYGTINGIKFTPTLQMDSAMQLAKKFCEGEVTWHPSNSPVPCPIHLNLADVFTTRILQEYESHQRS